MTWEFVAQLAVLTVLVTVCTCWVIAVWRKY